VYTPKCHLTLEQTSEQLLVELVLAMPERVVLRLELLLAHALQLGMVSSLGQLLVVEY
jgi:hypothetical protein